MSILDLMIPVQRLVTIEIFLILINLISRADTVKKNTHLSKCLIYLFIPAICLVVRYVLDLVIEEYLKLQFSMYTAHAVVHRPNV